MVPGTGPPRTEPSFGLPCANTRTRRWRMSDVPQGPGWWQANNDKWYPPEAVPGPRKAPAPVAPVTPPAPGPPQPGAPGPYGMPAPAPARTSNGSVVSIVAGVV